MAFAPLCLCSPCGGSRRCRRLCGDQRRAHHHLDGKRDLQLPFITSWLVPTQPFHLQSLNTTDIPPLQVLNVPWWWACVLVLKLNSIAMVTVSIAHPASVLLWEEVWLRGGVQAAWELWLGVGHGDRPRDQTLRPPRPLHHPGNGDPSESQGLQQ